jgi:hypothetical protein
VSGDFLFFEHVHPEKVLKNKLQVRDENLGGIELSSTSSDGDTREKRARESKRGSGLESSTWGQKASLRQCKGPTPPNQVISMEVV